MLFYAFLSVFNFDIVPIIGSFEYNLWIMGKNTSIVLGSHFEEFIKKSINSGSFNSASEVIRASLRLLEEEELAKQELIMQLKQGENSGYVSDFETTNFLNEMKSKYNKK
jgi:antitoxin ParD1/3/4